jgi:NitT/TauT family transport system substrate-binding protein
MPTRSKLVLAVAVAGIATAVAGGAHTQAPLAIHVGNSTRSLSALPIVVARDKGYLAGDGIALTLDYFAGGPPAVAALLGGSVQVLSVAFENNLKAVKIQQSLVTVVNVSNAFGGAILIRKDVAEKLGHPPSVTDLKGLRIGTLARGGLTDSLIRHILKANGLDPIKDVTLIPLKSGDRQLAAGDAGELDANMVTEPWNGIGVDKLGKWRYIEPYATARNPDVFRDIGSSTIQVARPYLEKNRALVEKLVQAVVRAQSFIATPDNFDEVVEIAKREHPSIDPVVLRKSVSDQISSFFPDVTEKIVTKNVELLVANGQIELPAPSYADTVDLSFKPAWDEFKR